MSLQETLSIDEIIAQFRYEMESKSPHWLEITENQSTLVHHFQRAIPSIRQNRRDLIPFIFPTQCILWPGTIETPPKRQTIEQAQNYAQNQYYGILNVTFSPAGTWGKGDKSHFKIRAHRAAWIAINHMLPPEGFIIKHICNTPRCVNPNHLVCIKRMDVMVKGGIQDYSSIIYDDITNSPSATAK